MKKANISLTETLAKICAKITWLDTVLISLASHRSTVYRTTGFTHIYIYICVCGGGCMLFINKEHNVGLWGEDGIRSVL